MTKEGISKKKVHFVGNVMIDSLFKHINKASQSKILDKLDLIPKSYAVLTLHRPSNVDNKKVFIEILTAIGHVQKKIKVLLPIHPRTKKKIVEFKLENIIKKMDNFKIVEALGYLDFLELMSESLFLLTDSGGIQEETTILNIPCITIRENTERSITVMKGTNIIAGCNKNEIIKESSKIIAGERKRSKKIELWDGKAAERIINVICRNFDN